MDAADQPVVVIVNPTKADVEEAREVLADVASQVGSPEPRLVETSADDPGPGQTRTALAQGARLVCALGGDGTVRAVAQELAGTGVPIGLLPGGTGNLLARNLGLPIDDLADAARVAFTGRDRPIDVGWLVVDPTEEQRTGPVTPGPDNVHCFMVMAGVGFDAQIMADAPEGLKDKAGWAAYVASGTKHLRDRPFRLDLVVDGHPFAAGDARTVVVGNCGELTGGMVLLPDAEVDDGALDVAALTPDSLGAVAGVVGRILGKRNDGPSLQRSSGREIWARTEPAQLCEVDGEVLTDASELRFVLSSRALPVRVRRDGAG